MSYNSESTEKADSLARFFPVSSLADAKRQAAPLGVTIRRDDVGGFEVYERGLRAGQLGAQGYAETLAEAVALAHAVAIERDANRVGFGGLSARSLAEAVANAAAKAHGLTGAEVTAEPIPGLRCARLALTVTGPRGPIRAEDTERATLAALAEVADELARRVAEELARERAEVLALTDSDVADRLAAVPGSDCVCLICGRAFATGPAALEICPTCNPADRAKAEADAKAGTRARAFDVVARGPAAPLAEVLAVAFGFGQAEAARLWAACRLARRMADPDDVAGMLADPLAYDLTAEELAAEVADYIAGRPDVAALSLPGLPLGVRADVAAMLAAGPDVGRVPAFAGDSPMRRAVADQLARAPELAADLAHVLALAAFAAIGDANAAEARAASLTRAEPAEAARAYDLAELTARRAAWLADLSGGERAGADAYAERLAGRRDHWQAVAEAAPVADPAPVAGPRVLDLTPTWAGLVPVLAAALTDGTERGRQMARDELAAMAKAADRWNAAAKADPVTAARLAGLPDPEAARVPTLAETVAAEESRA